MSDHTHECRDCGGDYTRCNVTNDECLSSGPKAHGSFNGMCDECEDAERKALRQALSEVKRNRRP